MSCFGKFDRKKTDCNECQKQTECQAFGVACYGEFARADICFRCPAKSLCETAEVSPTKNNLPELPFEERFYVPEQVDREEVFLTALPAFLKLFEECNHDPVLISMVICRFGGLSYEEIQKKFGFNSRQVVLNRFKSIKSEKLVNVLRKLRKHKYVRTAIREVALDEE